MERRVFNSLQPYFHTDQNRRETYIADDQLYEPEQAQFIDGYIGDVSVLTAIDLARTPQLIESDVTRQKYQLSLGVAYIDPDTGAYDSGAFYTDVLQSFAANGALTNNPNRLFGAPFYAWSPPIDYDKFINPVRYVWVGAGTGATDGEYITKEPAGSQTTVYVFDGSEFNAVSVTSVQGAPTSAGVPGQIVEDVSTPSRILYQWIGTIWTVVHFIAVDDIPTDFSGYNLDDVVYVCRTGPQFNAPLVWVYRVAAGRWIATPVVVSLEQPGTPLVGMIWEDVTVSPTRLLRIWNGTMWQPLAWTAQQGPIGQGSVAADATYIYDMRTRSAVPDGWSQNNWWRAYEDLSRSDYAYLSTTAQATRPIIEFWGNLEPAGPPRSARNQFPQFNIYGYNSTASQIQPANTASTIFQYQVGTGTTPDAVLGFMSVYDTFGQIMFQLTLETDSMPSVTGYRYFKDLGSGLVYSIWALSNTLTAQTIDENGLADVPVNLTNNADHAIPTTFSRSNTIEHFSSVIAAQQNFQGDVLGQNNYRFTAKDPCVGATMLDHEGALLRVFALVQDSALSIPDAMRHMGRDYNRIMQKFINRLNTLWANGTIATETYVYGDPAPVTSLTMTPSQAVDAILTMIFAGRTSEFPYWYSDMGTYMPTQIIKGSASVVGSAPMPIMIPNSAPRIGASPAYAPESFVDVDGNTYLRGHDGSLLPSFGDERDSVMLTLERRFFNALPSQYTTETTTNSARFPSQPSLRQVPTSVALQNFYGNYAPTPSAVAVNGVVVDYTTIPTQGLSAGYRVFSAAQATYANFSGTEWYLETPAIGDIFLNTTNNQYYIFNGFVASLIPTWNNAFSFDYADNDFRGIVRRDFEIYANSTMADFTTNTTFDQNNPFTWNYSSAGVEGNYKGIYRRIYGSVRPHSHPWEIAGYTIQPQWWLDQYVPTSYAADGTPRYADTHVMWRNLQRGMVNPLVGLVRPDRVMAAPIPVDANGNLLDPISAGIVQESALDMSTISNDWVYGDGGPTEAAFYDSYLFAFANALAAYLMKPALFVDPLWTQIAIPIGALGPNVLWRAPAIVDSTALMRLPVADVPTHLTLDSSNNVIQNIGLNAWIAEHVVINGGSAANDFARLIDNTLPSLAWQCSGYININRTSIDTLSQNTIPFEDMHAVLHTAPVTSQQFQSGVTIVRNGTGYNVYGFDALSPFFTVEVPQANVSGNQSVQTETFNLSSPQYVFNTSLTIPASGPSILAVLLNGFALRPQYVTITGPNSFAIDTAINLGSGDVVSVSVVSMQMTSNMPVKTFTVGNVQFAYSSQWTAQYTQIEYGHYFAGANDVVNFMVGYGRWLTTQGWVFDQLDANNQPLDWLSGAKSFAQFVVTTGTAAGGNPALVQGQTFSWTPMTNVAKFTTDFGLIIPVESIQNGAYGVINQNGLPIRQEYISTVGNEDTMTVCLFNTTDTIYGLRLYLSELQHVVFFSNVTKFNDLLYDPVFALYQDTLRVDSYRTTNWTGRMEAPGFIISGGALLPNFEKQAKDITRFYSQINPPDDPTLRDQARNLYGYVPNKSYLQAIDADDRAQFGFYLGAIHAKGTNRVFSAFARGTRTGVANINITEDWAWKVAQYGDIGYQHVRFTVNQADFTQQLQIIRFGYPSSFVPSSNINLTSIEYSPEIDVLPYDRTTGQDARWLIPPVAAASKTADLVFPLKNGIPDVSTYTYSLALLDLVNNVTAAIMFNWDPAQERNEPVAVSLIDYINIYDVARYTNGPLASATNGESWGAAQVGKLWWGTMRAIYTNYRAIQPRFERIASVWGRPLYYVGEIVRNNYTVTVTTYDPVTGLPANHGLVNGQLVNITGADQADYNLSDIAVTVASPTTFTFIIATAPSSPATGPIQVAVGDIAVYEWVESPVPPSQWNAYVATLPAGSINGTVANANNPSWVEAQSEDEFNNPVTLYYFWVRANTTVNPVKGMATSDVEGRLRDPVSYNIPLFGIIDANDIFVFTGLQQVQEGFAIDIVQDGRSMPTYMEWVIISEGDTYSAVPDQIDNKLLDCLIGKDIQGNPVPSPLLNSYEQYGTDLLPSQTVFADPAEALTIYLRWANTILQGYNLTPTSEMVIYAQLATEYSVNNPSGYWQRAPYLNPAASGLPVYDNVATVAALNQRTTAGLYTNGDIVHVIASSEVDPWTGQTVGATYQLQDLQWVEVGIDNHSVVFNSNVLATPELMRIVWAKIAATLTNPGDYNQLIFKLLYEMLRQNTGCDWFIKTSYLTAYAGAEVNTTPYVRPSEFDAIVDAINDLKPFRTKVRTQIASYTGINDPANVTVDDIFALRTTILFDRLSCNLLEDGGWDSFPWDTRQWDLPFWLLPSLGTAQYDIVTTIVCDSSTTEYTYASMSQAPNIYNIQLILLRQGQPVDPASIGVTMSVAASASQLNITLNQALNANYSIQVGIAEGFYTGNPTLPTDVIEVYPDLQPFPSTYQHAVARLLSPTYNPCTQMAGCEILYEQNSQTGGNPEERIVASVLDSMNMQVTTYQTPAFAGWDATPWDTVPFDEAPIDSGGHSFYVGSLQQVSVVGGVGFFPTSEDLTVGTTQYVEASSPYYKVAQFWVKYEGNFVQMGFGNEWTYAPGFGNIVEVCPPSPVTKIADGVSISYDFYTYNGISLVYRNGLQLSQGTDYVLTNNGNTVQFVQPGSYYAYEYATQTALSQTGDGVHNIFATDQSQATLVAQNVFMFVNSVLQFDTLVTGSSLILPEVPATGAAVLSWAVGSTGTQPVSMMSTLSAVSDGSILTYDLIGADLIRTFVFINGVYQIYGVDYTISANGVIEFTSAPAKGAGIYISVIDETTTGQHLVLTTSGSTTVDLPGVWLAEADQLMVFVGSTLEDGYSLSHPAYTITNGNPTTLTWTGTPPPNGSTLTVRRIQNVVESSQLVITVIPQAGDTITVVPNPFVTDGTAVRLVYDQWDLGEPIGRYIINPPFGFPDYDIVGTKMIASAAPVPGEVFSVYYQGTRLLPAVTGEIVSASVVDDIWSTHLLYDQPSGFETNRALGVVIADESNNTLWEWNGVAWVQTGTISIGQTFYVKRRQAVYEMTNSGFALSYTVGEAGSSGVLGAPAFGEGIAFGTYAYGTMPSAPSDYPDAYTIMTDG